MPFTEFYCDASTGNNINAGDNTANGVVTSTNGDWGNAAANRFTAASGTPFSGVSVGDFASVYLDGATVAVYIARVTAVNGGGASIDLSSTAKSGTAPTTGATGRSCTTGGVWKGPNGTVIFPFNWVQNTMRNSSDYPVRVNFKNTTNYVMSAAITHGNQGVIFQGYTTFIDDGGRFVIQGATTGTYYVPITISASQCILRDCEVYNNGGSGSAQDGVNIGSESIAIRVVAHDIRQSGFNGNGQHIECEAYSCNSANTSGNGGFKHSGHEAIIRCISHHNSGTNSSGFCEGGTLQAAPYINCIAHANGQHGFLVNFDRCSQVFIGCDSYDNGQSTTGHGFTLTDNSSSSNSCFYNCNAVANNGYGINLSGYTNGELLVQVINCGFGSGTMANASGTINGNLNFDAEDTVTYPSNETPWVDPDDGDFRINHASAKGAGRGSFLQTQSGYGSPNATVSYPDIGAAQHESVDSFMPRQFIHQNIGTY